MIVGVEGNYKKPSFNDVNAILKLTFDNKNKGKITRVHTHQEIRVRFDILSIL